MSTRSANPAEGDAAPGAFFATAAKGTEPALRDELRELRLRGVRADRGGVHFDGGDEAGWRACLESAIAVRVLKRLATFEAGSEQALYDGVRAIDWEPFLSSSHTLAVRAACRSSQLTHTQYIAQKTKDAIVDQLRELRGARPSVDLDDPDVGVFVHLVRDQATVYADLAGEPLHRRGWRTDAGDAPLKETLAAAIVRLSGWDRTLPILDPMCGAGTLLIEAARLAAGVPPGLDRARFGFERWASHGDTEKARVAELRAALTARPRRPTPTALGSDVDRTVLDAARRNARKAGVRIRFEQRDVRELEPPPLPCLVLTNPPYGERLEGAPELYRGLADSLARFRKTTAVILAGTPAIARAFRQRPVKSHVLFNGPIECRLLTYEL